jgi:ergot alkaloid biosynthesis protein
LSGRILVTGGRGKTGRRLVAALREEGFPYIVASREPSAIEGSVYFDWTKRSTWDAALDGLGSVYLVAPPLVAEAAGTMIDFAALAMERGAKRFVLLSASLLPLGGPAQGQVHLWLKENAPEWAVMRPSWFMQNFSEGQHRSTILAMGKIYSATGEGRVPFISADDVASVAKTLLTSAAPPNRDFVLTGGRLLSYDEIADLIGGATGRPIVHARIDAEELARVYASRGLSEPYARALASMDAAIARGEEERITACVHDLTKRDPKSFEEFIESEKNAWKVEASGADLL